MFKACLQSIALIDFSSISHCESYSKVYWLAPAAGSGCVTLRAMVAENEEVWYEDGAPLTAKICEDTRQPDDVTPQLNYECNACDVAKYEVNMPRSEKVPDRVN